MDDGERPPRGGVGLSAIFVGIWLALLLGVPWGVIRGIFAAWATSLGESSPGVENASQGWVLFVVILSLGGPLLGLGLAIWGRRKMVGIAFGLALCVAVSVLVVQAADRPRTAESPPHDTYAPPGGQGCYGDSPLDKDNPRCKGG